MFVKNTRLSAGGFSLYNPNDSDVIPLHLVFRRVVQLSLRIRCGTDNRPVCPELAGSYRQRGLRGVYFGVQQLQASDRKSVV